MAWRTRATRVGNDIMEVIMRQRDFGAPFIFLLESELNLESEEMVN